MQSSESKADTCAVLDAQKQRLARGRFELNAAQDEANFLPTSNVSEDQMQTVAFLWPDGDEALPITAVRPVAPDELRYHLTLGK